MRFRLYTRAKNKRFTQSIVGGLARLFLCAVLVLSPFLAISAQATVDHGAMGSSHHAQMSHDGSGHDMHDGHMTANDESEHPDCCDEADICTHEQCAMNAFQSFGMVKSAESAVTVAMQLSWTHDTIPQRDGHRPLLDPPIP